MDFANLPATPAQPPESRGKGGPEMVLGPQLRPHLRDIAQN
jgi:hypothetical protein